MSISKKVFIFTLIFLIGSIYWYYRQYNEVVVPKQDITLSHVIDECDAITEKAAASLVAIVETQRLEIAGRKAHVFKLCMNDRGYIENPIWTKFVASLVSKSAVSEHISTEEAFENLRRVKMKQLTLNEDEPVFWVLKNRS